MPWRVVGDVVGCARVQDLPTEEDPRVFRSFLQRKQPRASHGGGVVQVKTVHTTRDTLQTFAFNLLFPRAREPPKQNSWRMVHSRLNHLRQCKGSVCKELETSVRSPVTRGGRSDCD